MRTIGLSVIAGLMLSGSAMGKAQLPKSPPVTLGAPIPKVPELPPTPLPPPQPAETPPAPPSGFGVDMPGTIVTPFVRPPMPVSEAPIEVPPGPEVWTTFDYLMWRAKGGLSPAIAGVVLGRNARTTPINPEAVFQVNDNRINGSVQTGFRLTGGYWLDKPFGTGVEARFTMFMRSDDLHTYTGSTVSALARPFWDESRQAPALFQLSSPTGAMLGAIRIKTTFDSDGAEANYLRRGPAMIGEEMHWIMGMRYWSLEEDLSVEAGSRSGGMTVGAFDSFSTRNRFFGPQFGTRMGFSRGDFRIDMAMKLAVGALMEEVSISGNTTAVLPSGARVSSPGGFLALSSNSGVHERTKLAFMRDTSISIGYVISENIMLRFGADMVWISNVVRPGEQVSLNINPTLLPFAAGSATAPARPTFRFNEEVFMMYGFSVGLAVQF